MLPLRLVAVGSAACAGSSVAQVDVAIIYDKGGKHGQCSEGPRSYMTDCAMPSDYFTYILSAEPTLAIGQTCASLGYDHVSTDPVFSGFELYWKGGAAAANAFTQPFFANHTELTGFLNASRDKNPACDLSTHIQNQLGLPRNRYPDTSRQIDVIDTSSDSVVTYYDAAGVLPQCGEGPAKYMANCVYPCDFVGYLLSAKPVLLQGARCAEMGFTFATTDNIYTPVKLYWKSTNREPSIGGFFSPYFANHTMAFAFLNATRDATPACKLGSSSRGSK